MQTIPSALCSIGNTLVPALGPKQKADHYYRLAIKKDCVKMIVFKLDCLVKEKLVNHVWEMHFWISHFKSREQAPKVLKLK